MMNEGHFRCDRCGLFLEHGDSRDDVTSVYFWYFSTQKSFGKIVGNPYKLYIFGISVKNSTSC